MRSSLRTRSRGQTLVLMALTMLLVVLMVVMTLGISTRVKEKMEVQQVSDAAAYSTAVSTSRTLNLIAMMNRVHVANGVAVAANQSLISWTSLYRGALNELRSKSQLPRAATCAAAAVPATAAACATPCARWTEVISDLQNVDEGIDWDSGDSDAADQSREFMAGVTQVQMTTLNSLVELVRGQKLAGRIAEMASQNDPYAEWGVSTQGSTVSEFHINVGNAFEGTASLSDYFHAPRGASKELAVEAVHGSRGHPFVTNRDGGSWNYLIALRATTELGGGRFVTPLGGGEGEGWFADQPGSSESGFRSDYGKWAQASAAFDTGSFQLTVPQAAGCPAWPVPIIAGNAEAMVFSDAREFERDEHTWTGATAGDDESASERHTMHNCNDNCPGIWVGYVDLNYNLMDEDLRWLRLWGQPKTMIAMERDYSSRGDNGAPWEKNFRINFAGSDETFDNRGVSTTDGLDISRQYAISTAISYYHRPNGHWAEPPNFFNPFWRATLVSPAVDNRSHPNPGLAPGGRGMAAEENELLEVLGALPSNQGGRAADALEALRDADFLGWQ